MAWSECVGSVRIHRNIGGAISGHSSVVPYQNYKGHSRPFIGQKNCSIRSKYKQIRSKCKMCVRSLLGGPWADLWPFYGLCRKRFSLYIKLYNREKTVYVSVKSKLPHAPPPPRAYPGHLTPLPSRGGGNLIIRVFQGVGNLIPVL